jgi:hypothetical protein
MRAAIPFGASLLAAPVIAIVSCSGGTPAPVGLAQGCTINSDCEGDLVCVFGLCHVACVTSKDCNGEACILPGVCQLPAETKCSATLPCVSGLACVGDTCLATCSSSMSSATAVAEDGICLVDQACVDVAGIYVCKPVATDAGSDSARGSRDAAAEATMRQPHDSGRDSTVPREAAVDAGRDAERDRSAPPDARRDGEKDAAHDRTVPPDAGRDSGRDAARDGDNDSGRDAARDAKRDSARDAAHDGGADAAVDAARDSGKDAARDALPDVSASCPSAQTQFGRFGTGTAMAGFLSGVGARNAAQMFIFDGYYGLVPSGVDAGGDAGNGGRIPVVYAQAFDPHTGAPAGPAAPLFVPPVSAELDNPGPGVGITLFSAAVSPTGYIALVYDIHYVNAGETLYMAILQPTIDGGGAEDAGIGALELETTVLLQGAGENGEGQPFVIWSDAVEAFVASWAYSASSNYVGLRSYGIAGNLGGLDLGPVPSDDDGIVSIGNGFGTIGSVGVSGGLFGVTYLDQLNGSPDPALTVLDEEGHQVGPSIDVAHARTNGANWAATAGTANGFVYFWDNPGVAYQGQSGVSEVFLPVSQDAGVLGQLPDGGADAASPFPTFTLPGQRAQQARVIADGVGGAGGAGAAIQYNWGIDFVYVHADGVTHQGPTQVFAHQNASGDLVSMTNFAGSFVVSLYSELEHRTVVAATGCQTP